MNVLITLPSWLIKEIIENRKWYELRSGMPLKYNPFHNRIFVVEKGTNQIRLSFRPTYFIQVKSRSKAWHDFGDFLGISKDFYLKYTESKKNLFLWPITFLEVYKDGNLTTTALGIKHNPQAFCYFPHSKEISHLFTNP